MELMDQLKEEEDFREYVYDDATGKPIRPGSYVQGNPTIGWGRNLCDRGVNKQEAQGMVERDIAEAFVACVNNFPWFGRLTNARQCVIMSMCFNLGIGGLLKFERMLAAVERQDWPSAADEILDSKAARDLPKRYKVLARMMRNDVSYDTAKNWD